MADSGADRVVAIGGDGTAADVAAGLLSASRPVEMAHVPRGTANILALNLGIPAALDAAIAVAVEGVATGIDVGSLAPGWTPAGASSSRGAEPFLLSVGTGIHAGAVEGADRAAKRRWGVLAYFRAGWRALGAAPMTRYRLRLDGEEVEVEGTMIQVMNMGAVFRPSWAMAPGVSPIDGRLDMVVYRAETVAEFARVGARVIQGRPTATDLVLHRRTARVEIEAEPDVPVQRDGELAGTTPVTVEIRPRALEVVVPRSSPWLEAQDR